MTEQITPEIFAKTFRESIRVGFNWDRFFAETWPIEMVPLHSHEQLGRCHMPWYFGKAGKEAAYDDADAHPINLHDVPRVLGFLNDERQSDIRQYAEKFDAESGVIEFNVPTYALPNDRCFVLDRNHRLSALVLSKARFAVTLWNVQGPLDPDGLLDLIHWMPKPA